MADTKRKPLRVAVAQFDAVSGDFAANAAEHARLIEEAAAQDVQLVVFPELSLPGYAGDLLDRNPARCLVEPDGPELAPIRAACRAGKVAAVVGLCLGAEAGMTLSSLTLDRRGEVQVRYDKRHLDGHEKSWFVPGSSDRMLELDGWRLGLGICYDSSFPEQARALALQGADAYLVSGAFPLGDSDHRRSIYFPARALENTLYVAFANFVGDHAGLNYCGRSALYGPDGRVLADAGPAQPGLAVADFDPEVLQQIRSKLQMLNDQSEAQAPLRLHQIT